MEASYWIFLKLPTSFPAPSRLGLSWDVYQIKATPVKNARLSICAIHTCNKPHYPLWKEYLSYIQRNNRDGHKLFGPVEELF